MSSEIDEDHPLLSYVLVNENTGQKFKFDAAKLKVALLELRSSMDQIALADNPNDISKIGQNLLKLDTAIYEIALAANSFSRDIINILEEFENNG